MSETVSGVAPYRAQFDRLRDRLPGKGTGWLDRLRAEAMDRFGARGFPTRKHEAWKYTNLNAFTRAPFEVKADPAVSPASVPEENWTGECFRFVLVGGRFRRELSRLEGLPKGVFLGSFADALRERPELLREALGGESGEAEDPLKALNLAFAQDGFVLHVPAGTALPRPVEILHLADSADSEPAAHLRSLVVLEKHGEATVVERFSGTSGNRYWNNLVSHWTLAEGAQGTHYKIAEEGEAGHHVAATEVRQQGHSRYRGFRAALGGALVRDEAVVRLQGPGAECELYGLFLGTGEQHSDNRSVVDHAAAHCRSQQLYKGILADSASGVFDGRILVRPGAQKTDAGQKNQNLLLSREAEINSKPQLEIYADDVKCSHGATTGQLDERALFYLRSRGLDAEQARRLLTLAFAAEVVDRVGLEPLRAALAERLSRWAPLQAN